MRPSPVNLPLLSATDKPALATHHLSDRLFAKFDWNESVYNHLSCKIEEADGSHAFLINPYGLRTSCFPSLALQTIYSD